MNNHFEQHLNTKALIERFDPRTIVEIGCGESTLQLRNLQKSRGFRLICMDTCYDPLGKVACPFGVGVLCEVERSERGVPFEFLYGVSYLNLGVLEPASVDMAIIDTDHNGWTLQRELEALETRMRVGGLVLLHDTEAFKNKNGTMPRYDSGEVCYPLKEIEDGPTMGWVVDEYKRRWEVVAETVESNGAIAFRVGA